MKTTLKKKLTRTEIPNYEVVMSHKKGVIRYGSINSPTSFIDTLNTWIKDAVPAIKRGRSITITIKLKPYALKTLGRELEKENN